MVLSSIHIAKTKTYAPQGAWERLTGVQPVNVIRVVGRRLRLVDEMSYLFPNEVGYCKPAAAPIRRNTITSFLARQLSIQLHLTGTLAKANIILAQLPLEYK